MVKDWYKKELSISALQKRNGSANRKKDVQKIQSWLNLYSIRNPLSSTATGVDGDFGPATEKAVKNFQKAEGMNQTGTVSHALFARLCNPMKEAFDSPLSGSSFRDLVLEVAENHLKNQPYELIIKGQSNCGPWVRSYMDGNDGSPWFWCMGFAQAIVDQAAAAVDKRFTTLMPKTYSCDTVGTTGLNKGLLSRYQTLRREPERIKPGDIFLLQKSRYDWVHTGIITRRIGDIIETIEGNTNNEGSRNGIAVMKRVRNYRKSKIDIFSVAPLA